jgi:hypothetical protein
MDAYKTSLQELSSKNSTNGLCIQKVIEQGEKAHFKEKHRQKLDQVVCNGESASQLCLSAHVCQEVKPSRIQRFMQRRIGDWPIYSIFISLGQVRTYSTGH